MSGFDVASLMREEAATVERPAHGGEGWRSPTLEDFSANLNPLGPPPSIADIILRAIQDIDHYPDDSSTSFRAAIAAHYDLGESNVLPGAGSSELIRLFPEAFLEKGEKVLMPWPTFAEYGRACRLMGAKVIKIQSDEASGFRMLPGGFSERLDRSFKAVFLCNPNNPTATLYPRKQVIELVEECERLGTLVFLDETLLELIPKERALTLASEVESHDNLVVVRSLTKSFAIPGLRLGYGLGSRSMVACLDRCRQTWNLGAVEQLVGEELIKHCRKHVQKGARMLWDEKLRVWHKLTRCARLNITLPDAFFFFLDLRPLGITGAALCERLRAHDILVRDCRSFGPPFEHFVRFCVKTPEKDDELLKALDDALGRSGDGP